jgi:hypothetical protein
MNTKFDLTTKEGLLEAAKQIKDKDLLLLLVPGIGPLAYLGKKAIDAGEKLFASTEATIEQQKRAAIEIIKAGKESGAESLEVTLSQQAGLDFGSNIEGIPIKVIVGKSGNMTLKVKYAKA